MEKEKCLTNKEITNFVTYQRDSKDMTWNEFLLLAGKVNSHILHCDFCRKKVDLAQNISDKHGILSSEEYLLATIYGIDTLAKKERK